MFAKAGAEYRLVCFRRHLRLDALDRSSSTPNSAQASQQLRCHQALGDDLHLAPEVVTGQWADVHPDAQVAHYPYALVHHKGVLLTVRAGAQLVEAAGDRQPLGSPADLAVFLGTRRWGGAYAQSPASPARLTRNFCALVGLGGVAAAQFKLARRG